MERMHTMDSDRNLEMQLSLRNRRQWPSVRFLEKKYPPTIRCVCGVFDFFFVELAMIIKSYISK